MFGEPAEPLSVPHPLGHPALGDAGDGVGRSLPGNSEMWGISPTLMPFLQTGKQAMWLALRHPERIKVSPPVCYNRMQRIQQV